MIKSDFQIGEQKVMKYKIKDFDSYFKLSYVHSTDLKFSLRVSGAYPENKVIKNKI